MAKTAAQVRAEKAAADAQLAQAAEGTDAATEEKPKGYNQATGEFVV